MNDKEIEILMELAKVKLAEAKTMSKKAAIKSLNKAGILTTKGAFKKHYSPLEDIVVKKTA